MRARLTVAVVLSTLGGLTLLHPLFDDGSWWSGAVAVILAVSATGVAGRAARVPAMLLPPLQALVALCVVSGMYASLSAPLGFLPSPNALEHLRVLSDSGRAEINLSPTPVVPSPGVTLVVALSMALFAIVIDFVVVTLRAVALMGIALLALLLVPLSVYQEGVGWLSFSLAAAGYLLLLAVDGWERADSWGGHSSDDRATGAALHLVGAARIAVPAVVVALLIPMSVPGLASDAVFGMTSGVRAAGETITTTHPMVTLRRDLASSTNRRVLYFDSSVENPDYLRMYVLDGFDGENWTMSSLQAANRNRIERGEPLPDPDGLWEDGAKPVVTTITTRAAQRFEFLPAPYPVREVSVDGDWFVDPETLMMFSPTERGAGISYEVRSTRVRADRTDLAERDFPTSTQIDERYLDLPDRIDPRVQRLTDSIVKDTDSPHAAAVALQDWFTDGKFTYDLRPPTVPENSDPLTHFLFEDRTGYCEQFSASMAVMARQAGIPARVAVGYTPGERTGDRWVVTERNAHAWPELYFQGYGWLRFEPTPASAAGQGSATVPPYATDAPADLPETGPDTTDPNAENPAEQNRPDERQPDDPAAQGPEDTAGAPVDGAGGGTDLLPVVLGGAAVLLLLAAPALARALVRRARWARATTPAGQARAAWRELRDDLTDLGLPWADAETPRTVGRRLAADHGLDTAARESLRRIARAREQALYAPEQPEAGSLAADSRRVRAALRASADRRARIRAAVLPASVLRLPAPRPRTAARSSA